MAAEDEAAVWETASLRIAESEVRQAALEEVIKQEEAA